MASFVPLHGSWRWFKVKARARKVPGKARASDDGQASRLARRSLPQVARSDTRIAKVRLAARGFLVGFCV
jgi:hypothetical protein